MTERFEILRVAAEMAALNNRVLRQEPGQGSDCGGLTGAFLAPYQHAADGGHDGVQDQGKLH